MYCECSKESKIIYTLAISRGFYMLGYCVFATVANILVFQFTQSGAGIAVLLALKNIPVIVIGIFAGTIVDNTKKSVLIGFSLIVQAVLAFSLLFAKRAVDLYIIVFLYMVVHSFYKPAQSVVKPIMLNEKTLLKVNSVIMVIEEITTITASVLIGSIFANAYILLNIFGTICLLFAGISVLLIILPIERKKYNLIYKGPEFPKIQTGFLKETFDGWKYLITNKYLLVLAFVVALIWLGLGSFSSIQILFVAEALHLPEHYVGYSEAIISIGNILGYLLAPYAVHLLITKRKEILLMGLGYLLGGIALCIMGNISNIVLIIVALCIYATGYGFSNTIEETLEQTLPEEKYLGKCISIISSIGTIGYLLGSIGGPLLTDFLYVGYVVEISAFITIVTGIIILKNTNRLVKDDSYEG
ncbi:MULTISPECIES: MFS transporter [Hungatella]|uniref:MFS transporter n=1 Tax=Hungatella hathewayi TaxID=154046 RepID=A0AAW9WKS2_9FIRM|nr:MFS transporter [Hungatella sp. SL.1.14]MCQ4829684.1 MFS transporter [Hungatella sp. SL.1.14]MUB64617.1 MFS transporter [Hungatella hathewayi]CUQ09260.1 major facilitator superfamily protein [Hungatella hathewayi]